MEFAAETKAPLDLLHMYAFIHLYYVQSFLCVVVVVVACPSWVFLLFLLEVTFNVCEKYAQQANAS